MRFRWGLSWFLLRRAWASVRPVIPAPMMRMWHSESVVAGADPDAGMVVGEGRGGSAEMEAIIFGNW